MAAPIDNTTDIRSRPGACAGLCRFKTGEKALGNAGSFPECMGWLPDDAEEPIEQDNGAQTGED